MTFPSLRAWFKSREVDKIIYRQNARRRADLLMTAILRTSVLISALLSAATLFVAFSHLYAGLKDAYQSTHGAAKIIGAVEILLLSPLPYLVLRSLGRYAEDFYYYQALKPSTKGSLIETKCFMVGLLFTMLIANFVGRFINSTPPDDTHSGKQELVVQFSTAQPWNFNFAVKEEGQHTQPKTPPQSREPIMSIEDSIFGCAILLILILFYHRLEISYRESSEHETDPEFMKRISANSNSGGSLSP